MLGAQGGGERLALRAVLFGKEYLRPAAHHHRAHRAVVLLDGVALGLDGGLVHVDAALLQRLPVGVDVLTRGHAHDLRAQELAVSIQRQASLGVGLAPRHHLGLEGLAELHLHRQHHGLDDHLLLEGERGGDVVDVGARLLGRLRHRDGIARVLAPVGEEHEAVGVTGGGSGQRQLQRLGEIGPPPAHLHLRTVELRRGLERLIHHRLLAEDDEAGLVARSQRLGGLGGEAEGVLARGEAHAVRNI